MAARILVVDDHEVLREGVRTILNRARPQWEICGEAVNGQEAIEAAARLKPDIVLLDITMPGMSGLEAASRISALGLGGAHPHFYHARIGRVGAGCASRRSQRVRDEIGCRAPSRCGY